MIDSFRGPTRWLSNFGEVPNLMAFGMKIPTTEHGYQAAKCEDPLARRHILEASTPRKAKELGRVVILRDDWDEVRNQVMYTLLRRKFANAELRAMLLGTGDETLVEGNDWGDRYWGAEKVPTKPGTKVERSIYWWPEDGATGYKWVGKNQLGILLMRVRRELRMLRGL